MVSVIYILLESNSKLSASLNSVVNQTYDNFEIIIVGNEKIKQHQDVIDKLIAKGAPIKVYLLENQKSNIYAALYGAKKAVGDYLFFIAATDYVYQNYLEVLLKKMKTDRQIEIATASFSRYSGKFKGKQVYKEEVLSGTKKFDERETASYRLWNSIIVKDFLFKSLTADDLTTYNSTSFILSILLHCQKYYRHKEILYFRGSPPDRGDINVDKYIHAADLIKEIGLPPKIYYLFLLDELLIRSSLSLLPLKQHQEDLAKLICQVKQEIPKIKRFIFFMKRPLIYRRACLALINGKFKKAEMLLAKI